MWEFTPTPALVELLRLSRPEWMLNSIQGEQNGRLPASLVGIICERLDAVGVYIPAHLLAIPRLAALDESP